jgi:hypothetical protein
MLIALTTVVLADEPRTSGVPISFSVEKPGQVSAGVYDSQGRLVRELLHAVPMAAGKQSVIWDGLDREGKSLPAGEYEWKALQTPGLKATFLMSVGSNYPPGNDWRTACGPGTHHAPFGVAVDQTGIYVSAHTTENIETCMLKMTPDGKQRLWTTLHPRAWDGALSLAVDGGEVFMLGHVKTNDGRIAPEQRRKQLLYVYDAATGRLAKRTVAGTAVGEQPVMIDVQWDPANDDMDASDMDAHAGVLVVAYEKKNSLRWYDPQTGVLLDTAEVPSPAGVAVGADGVVFVSSGDRVVKLSRKNKTPTEFVAGLDKPGRLDVDHSSGELLVYEAGTQQIKRFSVDGVLKTTYGAKGGRKDGLYDYSAKRSFAGFADLCADGSGGFYVTEALTAPRRTAHFAADGSVVREWYGGQRWAPHAATEGDNPNVLWVGSQYGWVMRVLVDYQRKSWTVHSCYQYSNLADGLVGDSHNEGGYFHVYKRDGVTYLALEKLPTILKVDEQNWKLLPVTICGAVHHASSAIKGWAGKSAAYQWNDANGDGVPQQAEVTFYESGIANSWEPHIAADLSCFTASETQGKRQVRKFTVTRWNDVGAPIYGTMPQGDLFGDCPTRFHPQHFADTRWSVFMHQDQKSGKLYAAFNDWTRNWCDYDDAFMQQWSANGKSTWTVSQLGKGFSLPGEVRTHLRGIAGIAHDCVVAIDNDGGSNTQKLFGKLSYVWDSDGLFVGGLMDSMESKDTPKHWYQLGGEFCHASVVTLPDGDVLFFGNWENEMRVYRISGWNGWQRQSGRVQLTAPVAPHTGQGLTVTSFDDVAMTKPREVALDRQIDRTWSPTKLAPGGLRWTGTLLPTYGPAYVGPWSVRGDKECFEGACRGSRDNNASVSFRFRGTSIRVVGKTGPNYGFADIALDGQPQPQFDGYSPEVKRDATLFAKNNLSDGDHEVTVTVVGWHGKPRNKASSDSWVDIDKFVVNGLDCDDAGLPHTFTAQADGKLALWLNRSEILNQTEPRSTREELTSKPIKLLRQQTPLQLNYTDATATGGVLLQWSNHFQTKQLLPTSSLFPLTPGGYTVESLRFVGDIPKTATSTP